MPGCLSLFSRRSRSPSPAPRSRPTPPSSAAAEKAALSTRHPSPSSPMYSTSLPAYAPSFAPLHPSELSTLEGAIDAVNGELRRMSLKIQDLHELGMKEFKTHDLMTAYMEGKGFKVTRHAYGMETAWEAVFEQGEGGRTVGFNSEMVRRLLAGSDGAFSQIELTYSCWAYRMRCRGSGRRADTT